MPICHPIKAIFVHVPRCGGTSINSHLHKKGYLAPEKKMLNVSHADIYNMYGIYQFDGVSYELDHATPDIFKMFVGDAFLNKYFKFTFVRNPYSRLYSEYKRKIIRNDKRFLDATGLTFEQFVYKLNDNFHKVAYGTNNHFAVSHFVPQYLYVTDANGIDFVDYIGKFEMLTEHWLEICFKLGIEQENLPRLFSTAEEKVKNNTNSNMLNNPIYVSREAKALIYSMYSKDFEFFDYDPDY